MYSFLLCAAYFFFFVLIQLTESRKVFPAHQHPRCHDSHAALHPALIMKHKCLPCKHLLKIIFVMIVFFPLKQRKV